MTDIDTSERIKQRAHGLFMQYGLRSVSMDDIASHLGMSKKTIYQYYADKDELVEAVVGSIIHYNQSCCELDREQSDNAVHEIFLAMDFMMEMFRTMNPALLFEMQKYHPSAFQKFYRHKNEYLYSMIHKNIMRGIKEEVYRDNVKVDVLARFRVESMLLPFHPDFQNSVKLSLAVIQEELLIHYLFGLVSQKGYKMILKYQQEGSKKLQTDAKI